VTQVARVVLPQYSLNKLFSCCCNLLPLLSPVEYVLNFFSQKNSPLLACSPYSINETVSLQCNATVILQKRDPHNWNITIAWMRLVPLSEGAEEEIIYSSGFSHSNVEISSQRSYFEYSQLLSKAVLSISSLLTFITVDDEDDLAGRYGCRVLFNTIDGYLPKVIGHSNTVEIRSKAFYEKNQSMHSPCSRGAGLLHLEVMEFEHNGRWTSGSEVMLERFLMFLVVIGGFLTAYSCANLFKRKEVLHQGKLYNVGDNMYKKIKHNL